MATPEKKEVTSASQKAAVEKVKLTINGKEIEARKGMSVFEAAVEAGIFVPHYCYHPDLSVAGVCRMCMVEIEKVPKLQISCNTPVREGMVVHTDSEKAKAAQKGSLELHLINHPLDCPICDKAGECQLQNFYQDFGLYESRMDYDQKVHKNKVVDIGTIVLDAERCIMCSRCVRFTDEVTETHELRFFNRGDRTELKTWDDGPLKNDYTGNLADICPVGALTAKDFRFQQRVWFLDKTETSCTQCARGCSTTVSYNPKTKKLYRVEPRRNPDVNKSWICDRGRWDYRYLYSEDRLNTPQILMEGQWTELTWEHAFRRMHQRLQKHARSLFVVLSAHMTNEEAVDVITSLQKLGVDRFGLLVDENVVGETEPFDGILQHRDRTGNAVGVMRVAKELATRFVGLDAGLGDIQNDEDGAVWILGLDGVDMPWVADFIAKVPESKELWIHSTNRQSWMENANVLLPNTTAFEKTGTMVNALGRIHRVQAAIPNFGTARDGHALAHGIREGDDRSRLLKDTDKQLFESFVSERFVGKKITFEELDPLGASVEGGR